MAESSLLRRILKGLAIFATLCAVGVAVLLASLWLEHRTAISLPTPTGPFAVGRTTTFWTGDTEDKFAPTPGIKRQLAVWIWYPSATSSPPATPAEYIDPPQRAAIEQSRGKFNSTFLTRDLSKVRTHSILNPAVSPQQPTYPVVIFRSGASAEVINYSTLAEDLASHGYIVVAFDAPFRTNLVVLPDGQIIARTPENNLESGTSQEQDRRLNQLIYSWTADVAFALDQLQQLNASDPSGRFTGRLDLTRVGVFGHSYGGATAAQFCHDDSRCKAGIDIDGTPFGSVVGAEIHQPFLFLLSDHGPAKDPTSRAIQAKIQSIYDRQPPGTRLRLEISGANHYFFSEDIAMLKSHLIRRFLRKSGLVHIDGARQLAITTYCVHTFFDAYLKNSTDPPLLTSPLYPEIQVLK
jgi:dienelactone hydrolase